MKNNPCNKTRPLDNPYEIWVDHKHDWEFRVLRKYQTPENEAKNEYAVWYCAVKSPFTHGTWDIGDTYVKDVKQYAVPINMEAN